MDTRVAIYNGTMVQYTKTAGNVPNDHIILKPIGHEIYKMDLKYQMPIKYTNIFHSKALQNIPKLEFLVF
jgi:hypothetical protein